MTFVLPKDFIVDFLHTNLEDPRGRLSSNSETFSAGSTEYTLTASSGKVLCVTSLTVGGDSKKKWEDYTWDYQNQKVIFSSPTGGEVIVNFKEGTGWIYPDKVLPSLGEDKFPRINVLDSGGTDDPLAPTQSDSIDSSAYQIDIWVKKDFVYEVDSHKYSGNPLADYLAIKAKKVFKQNEDQLIPNYYNPVALTTPQDLGYDEDFQCFHKIFIVELNSINTGEII